MSDNHRTPISDDIEDSLQRLLQTSQSIQDRIFRISRRNFVTPVSVGELGYHAESIARDVADLLAAIAQTPGQPSAATNDKDQSE